MIAALILALFQGPPRDLTVPVAQAVDLTTVSDLELARATVGKPIREYDAATGYGGLLPEWHELRRRQERGVVFEPEFWRTLLIDGGYLGWRADWPVVEPFAVSLHAPPLEQGFQLRLEPRAPGWNAARASHWEMMCGLGMDAQYEGESYQVLGKLSASSASITFDVFTTFNVAKRSKSLPESDAPSAPNAGFTRPRRPELRRVGEVTIDVRPCASVDDALQRTEDPAIARELTRLASLTIGSTRDGGRRSALRIGEATWPTSIACNLEATLLHEGVTVCEVSLPIAGVRRRNGYALLKKLSPQILSGSKPAEGWTLRLRGTTTEALRDWDATHYWAGEVELLVSDLVARVDKRELRR